MIIFYSLMMSLSIMLMAIHAAIENNFWCLVSAISVALCHSAINNLTREKT